MAIYGQVRSPLIGKIVVKNGDESGMTIANISSGKSGNINGKGSFVILAHSGDTLQFKTLLLEKFSYVITEEDTTKEVVLIPFESKNPEYGGEMLQEIKINTFDLKSIGLDFSHVKRLTPGEARLSVATGGPIGALVSAISGRTKMLKKALAYEKQAITNSRLFEVFSKEELSNRFDIKPENIEGFSYYLAIDTDMNLLLSEDLPNRRKIEFRISELLPDYRDRTKE